MIKINLEKCINCLKCTEVCPFTVVVASEGKPKVQERKFCIDCYHCAATCPVNAISDADGNIACEEKPSKFDEQYNVNLAELVKTRRSYRHFLPKPVDREKIDEILQLTKWAPSAKNQHLVKWKVIDDEKSIDIVMNMILQLVQDTKKSKEILYEYKHGNNVVFCQAKTVLLAYVDEPCISPTIDATIAMTTAELLFQSQGIGTCWGGYLKRFVDGNPEMKRIFGLPEDASVECALLLGYPNGEEYVSIPTRK
ncbi:nitroreductase/NAD-dependent dihydropyrimidine dehydrogenase PreA subunit [Clostridiales Family XIII bacterium PM5-7]